MKRLCLHFFDDILRETVNQLAQTITENLQKRKPDQLYILMSSNGGSFEAGIVLHNFLKSISPSVEVVTHCTGVLHSASIVPFLAGTKRYAFPSSQFLIHRVRSRNSANRSVPEIREQLTMTDSDDIISLALLHESTGMPLNELQKLYFEGHVFDNSFAQEHGFIHETRIGVIDDMSEVIAHYYPRKEA